MKSFAVATLGLAVSCVSSVHAQSVCGEILRSANYNQYQSVNQTQQYSLQKANFCLAEYEKASNEQKAQIEASYKLFSGGAAGSSNQIKELQRNQCESKYGEYWFNQLGLQSQKIVSDKAMDTVAKCIDAYARGLQVNPTFTEGEQALTVSLTWVRPNDLPFKRVILAPSESIRCKIDGVDTESPGVFKNRVIKAGTSVTFSCERTAKSEIIAGEKVECLPPALVAIDVLESPVTLNLFRRCNTDYLLSKAREVEQQVQQLRNELSSVRQEAAALNAADVRLGIQCERVSAAGQVATCSAGFFVTGCSAGQNKGSIDLNDSNCTTHQPVDWTQARCCRLVK